MGTSSKKIAALGLALIVAFCAYFLLLGGTSARGTNPLNNTDLSSLASKKELKIAFGSCVLTEKSPIWDAIRRQNPDLFLLLGDNIYQGPKEFGNYEKIMKHYRAFYNSADLGKLLRSTHTFAIWDDHDFGPNNADSLFPHREVSLRAFRDQWSNPPSPPQLRDGVAHKISLPFLDILMTDDRSYRVNPPAAPVFFGEKQMQWIEEELAATNKPLMIIASGSQLLSQVGRFESLRDSPQEQQRLMNAIGKSRAKVAIVSGDLHFAQIIERKIGSKIIPEFSSSPLTAESRRAPHERYDPISVALLLDTHNFGLLTVHNDSSLTGEIFDESGELKLQKKY